MKETILACLHAGGRVLTKGFNRVQSITRKGSAASIVTEFDVASEKEIMAIIRSRHPGDNLIGEETGFDRRGAALTWVVDPLDGTSNYAAGLPWFGILIAVLRGIEPIAAGVYFPIGGALYYSEKGQGVSRDGQPVRVSREQRLSDTLCSYGLDGSDDLEKTRRQATQFAQLVNASRNVRNTNCFLDFAHTIDGRYGACVNQSTKIWDIAAAALMFPEAGGALVDLHGRPVVFSLDPADYQRDYAVVGSSPILLPQVLKALDVP
jgi:myo-inositol-1(or 4)-monophosphatase